MATTVYSFTFASGSGTDGWVTAGGAGASSPGSDGWYFYGNTTANPGVQKTLSGLTPGAVYTVTLTGIAMSFGSGVVPSVDGLASASPVTSSLPGTTVVMPFTPTGSTAVLRLTQGGWGDAWVKSVTVTMADPPPPTRQTFDTINCVRLLVERDPVGSELQNQLVNPNGALGAWGWTSPTQGTELAGVTTTSPSPSLRLLNAGASGIVVTTSHPVYMNPGEWIAGRWLDLPDTAGYRARFQFYDAAGSLLSSSTQSTYYKPTSNTTRTYSAIQAPANTSYARFRLDAYADSASNPPGIGTGIRWTNAKVCVAATSGALTTTALDASQTVFWADVTPSITGIDAVRTTLDVSTLTPRIVSAALDLATSTTLRPGHRVVLEALVSGQWQPIYTGRMATGRSDYVVTDQGVETVVTPVANDAASVLARTPLPESYTDGVNGHLAFRGVAERAVTPVPWSINDNTSQSGAVLTLRATDSSATMLDQVIRARDSVRGAGWIDRRGVLVMRDRAGYNAQPVVDTITDGDYNGALVVGYDTADAVNSVVINNWSGTTATASAPYRNNASIRRWGELSATYTTFGLSAAQIDALGAAILAGNAEPTLTPSQVTIALATPALIDRFALRDVGDRISITCTTPALSVHCRIVGVTHAIQRDRWLVTFDLALNNRVAMPTAT